MRVFVLALAFCLGMAPSTASAVVRDSLPASPPLTFSDGAVATAVDHCGDADLKK